MLFFLTSPTFHIKPNLHVDCARFYFIWIRRKKCAFPFSESVNYSKTISFHFVGSVESRFFATHLWSIEISGPYRVIKGITVTRGKVITSVSLLRDVLLWEPKGVRKNETRFSRLRNLWPDRGQRLAQDSYPKRDLWSCRSSAFGRVLKCVISARDLQSALIAILALCPIHRSWQETDRYPTTDLSVFHPGSSLIFVSLFFSIPLSKKPIFIVRVSLIRRH